MSARILMALGLAATAIMATENPFERRKFDPRPPKPLPLSTEVPETLDFIRFMSVPASINTHPMTSPDPVLDVCGPNSQTLTDPSAY